MSSITIQSDNLATIAGQPVVEISDLPGAVSRQAMDALARSLQRAGYRIHDQRIKPGSICPRCSLRPPASSRAKYCCECQAVVILEGKRRHNAICS